MISRYDLKRYLHYNPKTGIFVWLIFRTDLSRMGEKAGDKYKRKDSKIYVSISLKGTTYFAHRLAWLYVHGVWPDQIDHIDGNGLNNRLDNLRNVTSAENQKNIQRSKRNKSGCMGVRFNKQRRVWVSQIGVNGEHYNLYWGDDFFEACCARKSAEIKHGFHPNHGKRIKNRANNCGYVHGIDKND